MNIYAKAITEFQKCQFDSEEIIYDVLKHQPSAYIAAIERLRKTADNASWRNECIAFMRANQKIAAIKRCREATGMGLKESQDAVEALPL